MPTTISIVISDEGLPIVQAALDKFNEWRQNATLPLLSLEEFVEEKVEAMFAISDEEIEARERQSALDEIISQLGALTPESLATVSAAVAAETVKIKQPPGGEIQIP